MWRKRRAQLSSSRLTIKAAEMRRRASEVEKGESEEGEDEGESQGHGH